MKNILAVLTLLIIAAGGFVYFKSPGTFTVPGAAMEPTYKAGDKLKVSKDLSNIQRGSVIVYKTPMANRMTEHAPKRVVGLPGESVEIKNGKLLINGIETIVLPLAVISDRASVSNMSKITLKDDQYFVLGDNTPESKDSRYVGPISKEDIEYVVLD